MSSVWYGIDQNVPADSLHDVLDELRAVALDPGPVLHGVGAHVGYDYSGTLRGLLELFIDEHNRAVEEKKRFTLGIITVTDGNDYVSYGSSEFTVTLDAIREKLIKTHGGFLRVRYVGGIKYLESNF